MGKISQHITVNQLQKSRITLLSLVFLNFSFLISFSQDTIAFFNFDIGSNLEWITGATDLRHRVSNNNSWDIGSPSGGQGYSDLPSQREFIGNPDPLNDHSVDNDVNYIAGQGLSNSMKVDGNSGYYNNSIEWIRSPQINCSNFYNTKLSFWRWANFEPGYDKAFVELSYDGSSWTKLDHPTQVEDNSWVKVSIDISQLADGKESVYIRWRSRSDRYVFYSGWNIDDVLVEGNFTLSNFDSQIALGDNSVTRISSLNNSPETQLKIGSLVLSDAGSGDGLPTIIDSLIITEGNRNTVNKWKSNIAAIGLVHSSVNTANNILWGKVKNNRIKFGSGNAITIPDGTTESIGLVVYLKDLLETNDGSRFHFNLKSENISNNMGGSFIAKSNKTLKFKVRIDVRATEIRFTNEPEQLISANRPIMPTVEVSATDINGNVDIDFEEIIELNNTLNLNMLNTQATTVAGKARFTRTEFTGTGGPVYLEAQVLHLNAFKSTQSSVQVNIAHNLDGGIYFEDFDQGTVNWSVGSNNGNNSWEQGIPKGGLGYSNLRRYKGYVGKPDPKADYSTNGVNNVFGQGLATSSKEEGVSSHYNNTDEWLQTPPINCASHYNVQLNFMRWANFEENYDTAYVEVSNDGVNWFRLAHEQFPQDRKWERVSIDISEVADRMATVYVRWGSISDDYIHYSGWNIDNVEVTGIYSPSSIWTGKKSSQWNNAENWEEGQIPSALSSVTIPSNARNMPVISAPGAVSNDMVIETKAVLEILEAGDLTIYGDLELKTDKQFYGAVIDRGQLNLFGVGIIQRYVAQKKWQYVSSPFNTINTQIFGNFTYEYNEVIASENWLNGWQAAEDQIMVPGKGYDVYKAASEYVTMSGQFNTGDLELVLTNTDGAEIAEHEGWNLIGNPYPSVIDWDAAQGWQKTNVNNAIYIWDKELQNFVTYVSGVGTNGGTNHIPPMQGFFVKVSNPGTGLIKMTNDVRIKDSKVRLKSTGNSVKKVSIELASPYYSDETIVRFEQGAGQGFDQGLDAEKKFTPNIEVPQLYTKTHKAEPLAINSLSNEKDYQQINLYYTVSGKGSFELKFSGNMAYYDFNNIYLEDKATGSLIDVRKEAGYFFTTGSVIDSARFILHINKPLELTYKVVHNTINGNAQGAIDIDIIGGAQPIKSTEWSNGINTEDLNGLRAGKYTVVVTDRKNKQVSATIAVMQPNANGELTEVSDLLQAEQLEVYMVDNYLVVQPATGDNVNSLNIFALSGKTVYSSTKLINSKQTIELDLTPGMYLVQVEGNGKLLTKPFVIK